MNPERVEELAQLLGERLDIATAQMVDYVHKYTGQRLAPAAIDVLRNKLAWTIGLTCVSVLDNEKAWRERTATKK